MTIIRLDDMQIGDWFAVERVIPLGDIYPKAEEGFTDQAMLVPVYRSESPTYAWQQVSGIPFQIIALSMPFATVYCPLTGTMMPMDTRQVVMRRLNTHYVQTWKQMIPRTDGPNPPWLP